VTGIPRLDLSPCQQHPKSIPRISPFPLVPLSRKEIDMINLDSILLRNLENAKHSTGPRTPEGKLISSGNALKDGLYSKDALIPIEDRDEYLKFGEGYVAALKPVGLPQEELVQAIADCFWRLRRIRTAEANQMDSVADAIALEPHNVAAAVRILEAIGRHETRIHNQAIKSMKQLAELQKQDGIPAQEKETKAQSAASGFVFASPDPVPTAARSRSERQTIPPPKRAKHAKA
jgi:hypothetical protein